MICKNCDNHFEPNNKKPRPPGFERYCGKCYTAVRQSNKKFDPVDENAFRYCRESNGLYGVDASRAWL